MNIIAISRGTRYSPGHVGNDAAIYNKVVEELRHWGHIVRTCAEDEFLALPLLEREGDGLSLLEREGDGSSLLEGEADGSPLHEGEADGSSLLERETDGSPLLEREGDGSLDGLPDVVVTMARDPRTLARLMEWEARGVRIINSPRGVLGCVRRPMTEQLVAHGVPHPRSWIVATDEPLPAEVTFPCWLKRGDSHVVVKADVSYASTRDEALCAMGGMRERGIPSVVINEHLAGDLVKFYGVQADAFFHWFYPSATSHSKFGLEAINGEAQGLPFDPARLKQYADEAARLLHVPIYGGDAVVSADGSVRIIDFNDWPSFAPCRDEAARAIARRVR